MKELFIIWKSYTKDQFQANSIKKLMGHFKGSKKNKIPPNINPAVVKYENFVWVAQQQNFHKKLLLKRSTVISKEDVLFKAKPSTK